LDCGWPEKRDPAAVCGRGRRQIWKGAAFKSSERVGPYEGDRERTIFSAKLISIFFLILTLGWGVFVEEGEFKILRMGECILVFQGGLKRGSNFISKKLLRAANLDFQM